MRHATSPRLVLALALTLLFSLELVPQAIVPAHAADASLVLAVHQAIMTWHIERPDPVKLLAAAVDGLRQALARAGITERIADLTSADETTAKAEFQARFDRAVRLAQGKLTVTRLQYAASAVMAESLSGSTQFYTPEQWQAGNLGFGKGIVDIGIWRWHRLGRFVIFSVAPYSPAASAGLRPFDRVLAVDGQRVQGMTREEITSRIRGLEGTTVTLTVRRPGRSAPLTLSIIRQRFMRFPNMQHRMLGDRLGYIWIRSLGVAGDQAEFRRAMVELQRDGMRGLILDLRLNSSIGYVKALLVANTLLPAGVPFQTFASRQEDVDPHVRREACPLPRPDLTIVTGPTGPPPGFPSPCTDTTSGGTLLEPATPLVVLIDEDTRHFGETLSAAVRDTRRGKLLGVRTPGRVGIGRDVDLPGGAGIDVERFIVLSGSGAALKRVGVQPDVPVELTAADLDRGVDTQLQRAVQILSR